MRGATARKTKSIRILRFQSTHPVRGATRSNLQYGLRTVKFQSTHPVRGATLRVFPERCAPEYFNPRTPCGVRLHCSRIAFDIRVISIHAPRAGCDIPHKITIEEHTKFQSTHPVRGATTCRTVSTHVRAYFNPRTPCGVRLGKISPERSASYFNPRTPCGVRRQTCTTWFAPIFATLPNQMYVCLHYTCFTTLFQPKTWFSAVFQRCEAPRESKSAPASHRVKASAAPPAHRSAWRRYAQRGSDSYSQDCKSAGCPSPG